MQSGSRCSQGTAAEASRCSQGGEAEASGHSQGAVAKTDAIREQQLKLCFVDLVTPTIN